jgi:branched-chain amino acid transport system ATP-binding protein
MHAEMEGLPLSAAQQAANGDPALEIAGLQAWYGESHILHGVDLRVNRGEVITLLGRNGAGRTTTMRAIMGLTGRRIGSIKINGRETVGLPPRKSAAFSPACRAKKT